MEKRLLIIGGSGFIGQYLNKTEIQYDSISTFYSRPFSDGIYFDLEKTNLTELIEEYGFTHVLFLAGIVNFNEINRIPEEARYINIDCTINRIEEVINSGIVPVYFSSESVFSGKKGNYTENDKPNPIFEYAENKYSVEQYITNNTDNCFIFRLSKVFSSEKKPKSLVTGWLDQLERNEDINVAIDNIFCPIHIKDVITLVMSLIGIGKYGIYNICSSKPYSRSEMLDIIVEEYSKYFTYTGKINR
ncbi:uncharacterized protein METZ01_LOCUS371511, partial [marine metagenome]